MVKSNFAGRGMYMPQSIKWGSGYANHRNREAMMLASKGRYVQEHHPGDVFSSRLVLSDN